MAPNTSITRVPGLRAGHAGDASARTGCTVLLGPFRGACIVSGLATGTRELDVFNPNHVVESIDALLLTGGSAYGLGAAMGVVEWLRERGLGFRTGAATVPIVPAAVIYDLGVGRADRWPDPAMARAACDAASGAPLAEGAVGAGTGATVGKMLGMERAARGGVGCAVDDADDPSFPIVAALAVVNALGDVLDGRGGILAGPRLDDGTLAASAELIRRRGTAAFAGAVPPSNTTLTVVATDAPLGRTALASLARMAATALPRRISPVHTPFDGDITFALSTAPEPKPAPAADLFTLGVRAAGTLERAIERAVSVA